MSKFCLEKFTRFDSYLTLLVMEETNMASDEVIISLSNVVKGFGDFHAVDGVSLDIKHGQFVTILGPSGCGKTTTLRMIGGFELPTSGTILLNGKDITLLPPYKRPINTVFQRYALFPHLDVYDNVAFGLKLKKIPSKVVDGIDKKTIKENKIYIHALKKELKTAINKNEILNKINELKEQNKKLSHTVTKVTKYRKYTRKEIDELVSKALSVVDLSELENRDVTTLSGGQQQRVAIARCIVNKPEILLLDEPLGALDLKMRKEMQLELKEMHKKLGITFIYVTHDQEEALTMSDIIVVMKDGIIQQVGTPTDIYNEPKNAYVADFIGESNIYNGLMVDTKKVRFLGADFSCVDDFPLDERVDVVVRPEDVILKEKGQGAINGRIVNKIFKGIHYEYVINVGKYEIIAKSTKDFSEGEIAIEIEDEGIHVMKKERLQNLYANCEVLKDNRVELSTGEVEVDLTQLVKDGKMDEDGYVISGNKKYDFVGAKLTLEIPLNKIEISDDVEFGQLTGKIVSAIYHGDHYLLIIRTEDEEDFILETPDTWNVNDVVGININKKDIKIRFKGDISEYEI